MLGVNLSAPIIAIANIESASVSFSLVKLKSASSAIVLSTRYAELPLEERTSGQHLFALKQRLGDLGRQVLSDFSSSHTGSIKKLYGVVHAPWASGTIVKAAGTFQEETYISSSLIADCAAKALGDSKAQATYLDARQLPIMLNGYRTSYPEGKYAHLLELAALVSTCDENVRKEIETALREFAPLAEIAIHSGTRAILEALELARPDVRDAICLHVSGEGTEVIVIRGGIAERYAYVEEGLRTMLQRAFPGVRPEEARTSIRLMQRQEGSAGTGLATEEALLKAEPEMARAFGEGLAELSAHARLPNTLLLIADSDIAPWLQKFFERIDFSQFTITAQPFRVDVISASEFGATTEGGEKNGDLSVAIAISHVLSQDR